MKFIFNGKELNVAEYKKDKETKIYNLKDSNLKCFNINYYNSSLIKSKAQLYIFDFKKEKINIFNDYFFKPPILSFDFFNKIFENNIIF